eukprot:SAG31_NODE_5575_length_2448_cov_1.476799_2_plen_73_part_00
MSIVCMVCLDVHVMQQHRRISYVYHGKKKVGQIGHVVLPSVHHVLSLNLETRIARYSLRSKSVYTGLSLSTH